MSRMADYFVEFRPFSGVGQKLATGDVVQTHEEVKGCGGDVVQTHVPDQGCTGDVVQRHVADQGCSGGAASVPAGSSDIFLTQPTQPTDQKATDDVVRRLQNCLDVVTSWYLKSDCHFAKAEDFEFNKKIEDFQLQVSMALTNPEHLVAEAVEIHECTFSALNVEFRGSTCTPWRRHWAGMEPFPDRPQPFHVLDDECLTLEGVDEFLAEATALSPQHKRRRFWKKQPASTNQ